MNESKQNEVKGSFRLNVVMLNVVALPPVAGFKPSDLGSVVECSNNCFSPLAIHRKLYGRRSFENKII
jgi:hypothetical protein